MAANLHTDHASLINRTCPGCGLAILRRITDYDSSFKRRKYCSNSCARRHANRCDPRVRFARKVDAEPGHGPAGDCHLWRAHRTKDGYGTFAFRTGSDLAHRVAYELAHGSFSPEKHVCHSCDNPPCVNPAHLFLSDHAGNMSDMAQKGRAKPQFGEGHTSAKLTESDVRAIRRDDRSNDKLALVYGVSKVAIRCARSRKTWKHVA